MVALLVLVVFVAVAVAVPAALRAKGPDPPRAAAGTTSSPAAFPSVTSTSGPTSTVEQVVTPAIAEQLKANELGRIPVLMYHRIGEGDRPPDGLRDDIVRLKKAGFYPTTVREMVEGAMDIPAGKSPVVLTFDDSSPTHYRILDDGSLDPDCAIAILQAAVAAGDWAPKATFFPLLYVNPPANIVFGQPEHAEQKLRNLVEWGYEIGSHSMTHQDLSVAGPDLVGKELAQSKAKLEALIGDGYEVYTLAPPYGEYPDDVSILLDGEHEGVAYRYSAVVKAWGDSAPSPFSSKFDSVRIPRITAAPPKAVADLLAYFERYPKLRFVSDGDPGTLSFPQELPSELGDLRSDLDLRVVRY